MLYFTACWAALNALFFLFYIIQNYKKRKDFQHSKLEYLNIDAHNSSIFYHRLIEENFNRSLSKEFTYQFWIKNDSVLNCISSDSNHLQDVSIPFPNNYGNQWLNDDEKRVFSEYLNEKNDFSVYYYNTLYSQPILLIIESVLSHKEKSEIEKNLKYTSPCIWMHLSAKKEELDLNQIEELEKEWLQSNIELTKISSLDDLFQHARQVFQEMFKCREFIIKYQNHLKYNCENCDKDSMLKIITQNSQAMGFQIIEDVYYNSAQQVATLKALVYRFGSQNEKSFICITLNNLDEMKESFLKTYVAKLTDQITHVSSNQLLLSQKQIFQTFLDLLPRLIAVSDSKNNCLYANKAFKQKLGLTDLELLRENSAEGIAQFDLNGYKQQFIIKDLNALNTLYLEKEKKAKAEDFTDLYRIKKLSAVGAMAAGIAHEIKNPLVPMKMLTKMLDSNWEDAHFRQKYVAIILPQIQRIIDLCHSLSDLKKFKPIEKKKIHILDVFEEVKNSFQPKETQDLIQLSLSNQEAYIFADFDQLVSMLFNLVKNALEASEHSENLWVKIFAEGDWVKKIEVIDKGKGITEEERANLFKLFFSTKQDGNGLGLMMVKRVAEAHQANIDIDTEPGVGTTFCLTFNQTDIESEKNILNEGGG